MAPSSTTYHRFRDGERCDECGARQWYAEDAIRYCRRGHRLEGFAAHAADEDAFGTLGRVSRKKKEKEGEGEDQHGPSSSSRPGPGSGSGGRRGRRAVKLSGDAGRELYLEILQLVLRRQVRALREILRGGGGGGGGGGGNASSSSSRMQGPPPTPTPPSSSFAAAAAAEDGIGNGNGNGSDTDDDLEHVVRSLWVLRIRNLPLRVEGEGGGRGRGRGRAAQSGGDEEGGGGGGGWGERGFSGGGGSSASELGQSSGGDDSDDDSDAASRRIWEPDARGRGKLPTLVDALALCYLGCLVKRLPVTTADFHRWTQRGEIEFLAAINSIPKNARDRLPSEYHRALQVRDHIRTGHLQAAVQQLVISFRINFDLVFPPLNYVPILIQYIKELLLPVETYPAAKCIAEILRADFAYPQGGKRIRSMSNPEVLLVTLVVVAAKLLYSLDGVERAPRNDRDPRCLRLDWAVWREAIEEKARPKSDHLEPGQEYKVTPNDALTMDETKLDDYMDWFERMWIGDGDARTEVLREPFMSHRRLTSPMSNKRTAEEGDSDAEIARGYRAVNRSIKIVEAVPDPSDDDEEEDEDVRQPRDFCPVWRGEEDLPDAARTLYREAAELAATPLLVLVRAASQVERRLEVWCIQRAKERKREREKEKAREVVSGVTDSE